MAHPAPKFGRQDPKARLGACVVLTPDEARQRARKALFLLLWSSSLRLELYDWNSTDSWRFTKVQPGVGPPHKETDTKTPA